MSYCKISQNNELHKYYHDHEYGFPVDNDNILLERLALEINQAGLSWDLMLKKREAFNKAFENFDIEKVSRFNQKDVERLLSDAGIVRNRLKIEALINNAKIIKYIQREEGSFSLWLLKQSKDLDLLDPTLNSVEDRIKCWIKIFKKRGFKFIGGEIMKEFLQSIGYLTSPHDKDCSINKDIFKAKVLQIVKNIPKGQVMTYGEVAKVAGNYSAARAVGVIMKQNQNKKIPCHRVVAKNNIGGYNGLRGDKLLLLTKEGAFIKEEN